MNARRHSPAVYRRRRLMVLVLAILAIAALVWLFVAQPWSALGGGSDETQSEPTPSASETTASDDADAADSEDADPTPSPTPTDDGSPKECDPNAITVKGVTDKREYGGDEKPKLSMSLENTGDVDCIFNVGTTQQVYTVLSGNDVWWRSTDCQKEPSDMEVTLEAGQKVSSAEPVVWDRTRSSVDSCGDESRPVAPGGGASFHLRVAIGGIESEHTRQFILR
ncbi:hypothetical protein [Microbacterium halotolerans]|uniref:hypothetical protein n=1 Tax=Microbacterium halotolerans TaxID=246613 RepID=UPI001F09A44E|nr:hypothetical protein [Microbacterium halotolerans]